ncbi:endopolyphosphatase [Aspergillus mulundensis]|uniref:Endopolyphosphatase n=1 Tax=Aspergillus mulundensis TaxID=1810919 RepID=A0A3D8RR98_9EURO|nr:Endopolyphosphatase [Aspergillus mulundensis]RDW76535.1 Endopolyphosphatase [Aspergillus mulundensis]
MIPPRLLAILYGVGLFAHASAVPVAEPEQQVLGTLNREEDQIESSRRLSGRFLHITDFHLDTHYKEGTSAERVCHRDTGTAGFLGAEGTDCDSPQALIDETFRWIERNLKGEIDFVLWTGDSARHDNDEKIPRTAGEIIELNKVLAAKFIDVFEDSSAARGLSIPVIPTIGNNDIMPHNIFREAPNRWTRRFTEVWSKFIPEAQRHTFEEGGWFSAELVPNKLAAISLNTMYFYESNSAVDGCAASSEPGFEHMEWLRVQLEILRERKMKAILIGHVPPARSGDKRSWDESCWQKYTLFMNRFRDVVVGSVYGHMNVDHFMLQDSRDVDIVAATEDSPSDPSFSVQSRSDYLSSLREDWAEMPSPPDDKASNFFSSDEWDMEALGKKERRFLEKIGGPFAERYSVSLVSPSVVPNYFPTLRVVEYNTTGLDGVKLWADTAYSEGSFESLDWDAVKRDSSEDVAEADEADDGEDVEEQGKKKKKKKNKDKKKKKKPNFKIPDHPSKSELPGPAYSNKPFTWLGLAQYYANLTEIYEKRASSKTQEGSHTVEDENTAAHVDLYHVEYDTRDDNLYSMRDLTVRSYFRLAKRIAKKDSSDESALASDPDSSDDEDEEAPNTKRSKKKMKRPRTNQVWRTFLDRAFVGFLGDDELDDIQI